MTRYRSLWLWVSLLVLVATLSICATWAVLEIRHRSENPLQPPPVSRTIALREVLTAPGAEEGVPGSSPVPPSAVPARTGEEVVDLEASASQSADEGGESAPPPAPPVDVLGLPALQGLALDFPGKDGPQRVEDARPVTERAGFVSPRWSPLGIDLAVVRPSRRELFIQAPLPGAAPRFVMRLPQPDSLFTWNDDGMTLRVEHPGLGGWVEVLLTGEIYPSQPPASPVMVASGRIILLPPFPGGQPVLLSPPGDEYDQPLLSPDGAWTAFRGKRSGLTMASLRTNLIWRIGPGKNPVWKPDSSGLIFVRTVDDLEGPVGGDLWLATVDGKYLTNLTRSPGLLETQPDMAPDGERTAFVRGGAIFVGVFRGHLDDSVQHRSQEIGDRREDVGTPTALEPADSQSGTMAPDPDASPEKATGSLSRVESLLR
jgi:hypothetical protein